VKKYFSLEQETNLSPSGKFELKVKKARSGDTFAEFSEQRASDFLKNKESPMRKTQKYIGNQSSKFLRLNTV
jgi:hypothetical protein